MSLFSKAEHAIFSTPKDPNNQPSMQGVADLFKNISFSVSGLADLSAVTSSDVGEGDVVFVAGIGSPYERAPDAATDAHLDYSGSGGVKWYVKPFAFGAYDASAMGLAMDGSTDDSAKVQQLGQWIADNGGGVLFLPEGDLGWHSRVEIHTPATTTFASGYEGFTLVGNGTRCILPNTNVTGGIKITRNSRPQTAEVRGISFLSYQPIGSTASDTTNSGVGIYMASGWNPDTPTALGWGTQPQHQVIVENCFVGSGSGLAYGRWAGGIAVEFAFFAQIRNNSIESNHWNDVYDDPPVYEDPPANGEFTYSFGMDVQECYTPSIHGNRIKTRSDHCVRIWSDDNPAFEDWAFYDNIVDGKSERGLTVECTDAGYVSPVLGEPGGRVWGNHFNAHRFDVTFKNIRHVSFTGNFTHLSTQAVSSGWYTYFDETALRLINCQGVQVVGNAFQEGGHFTNINDCSRNVTIDADCANISFDANTHGSLGIAYDCSASEAMSITFGPSDTFGFRQGDGVWRYPEYYHHMRTSVRQRVHAPPLDISDDIGLLIGGSSTGITYDTKRAIITRHGDTATLEIEIKLTSKGGLTGSITIPNVGINVPAYKSPLTIGFMGGDTGLAQNRSMRAFLQANGDITLRYTDDATSPYQDTVLTGALITDTFEIQLSGTYALAGVRDIGRAG